MVASGIVYDYQTTERVIHMARMIGDLRTTGCTFGKHCTCNGMYRDARTTRATKRRERNAWKREVALDN